MAENTSHAQRRVADAARERKLVRAGYTELLRVPASLVERSLEAAVERVRAGL